MHEDEPTLPGSEWDEVVHPAEAESDPDADYNTWLNADAAKKLSGQFSNRLFAQHLGDGLLRLNFGDVMDPDEPTYHTALVITAANAVQFAQLIYRMGMESQAAQEAVFAAAAAAGVGDGHKS